jgi:hypothetical protein
MSIGSLTITGSPFVPSYGRPMKKLIPVALSLLVLVGCEGGADRGPREADSERFGGRAGVTDAPPSQCSNQEEVTGDEDKRIGGELTGDVDGDDQPDSVNLSFDEEGKVGCQAFLVAEVGDTSVVAPIWEVGSQGGLPRPRLHGIAEINGDEGLEILVDEVAGASTQFVAVYTYDEGSIEKIEPRGVPDGLFAYGGSVGHIEAAGCAQGGDIVVSQALPGETRGSLNNSLYDVTRRFFSALGDAYTRERVERHREVPLKELDRFEEFGTAPFGNCPAR